MARGVITLAVASCFAAVSTVAAFAQATSDPTPGRVADVYVGTPNGVYLYHAATNGSLSLVTGSPYPVAGTAVGSNHKYFFSLDPTYLHSYPVASNGAIGSQASQTDTQVYGGSECGTVAGAVLGHTGDLVYAQLEGGDGNGNPCSTLQSFKILNTGALSFLGSVEFATANDTGLFHSHTPIVKMSGNGKFAFSAAIDDSCTSSIWILTSESNGAMTGDYSQYLTVPSTPSGWRWYPWPLTSDPTDHVAVAMKGTSGDAGPCPEEEYATQLASFTVASDGNLSSTNTPDKMPTPKVYPGVMNISYSGEFLAVGGGGYATQTSGLQVFHFNGANPITPYSGVLTSNPIDLIRWDRNHHLYALSVSTNKLYVYTVTSTSITAAPGSPYTVPSTPSALSVAPVMCSAPDADGVHICDPAGGSTVASPVLVEAAGKVPGNMDRMELWVDGVKKDTIRSTQLDTTVKLAAGKHHFSVFAINTAGQKWQSAVDASVK